MHFGRQTWQSLRREVADRLQRRADSNIIGFGFGTALRDGWIDSTRPFVVRYYVRRKKSRGNVYQIPNRQSLTLTNANRKANIQSPRFSLPTDVIEIDEIRGGSLLLSDPDAAGLTTGTVVRWQESHRMLPSWGVLTVAHGFERNDTTKSVSISASNGRFSGQRWIESDPTDSLGIDVALVRVSLEDLIAYQVIASPTLKPLPVISWPELNALGTVSGRNRQSERRVDFLMLGTIEQISIGGVGQSITSLIHVQAALEAFPPGTSGGLFELTGSTASPDCFAPAAIQIGSNISEYTDGFAQSLDVVIQWLRGQIALTLFRDGQHLVNGRLDIVGSV